MKKLFSVMKEVETYLNKYPLLRDNDEKLMANIWWKHVSFNIGENASGKALLSMLAEGKLPSYESISRCRRKIQEKKPHLRGEKWNERHGRAKEIRREIAR
jgi:polysaccharide pyruvyl transferase WcaK-like protein